MQRYWEQPRWCSTAYNIDHILVDRVHQSATHGACCGTLLIAGNYITTIANEISDNATFTAYAMRTRPV